jgi:hypothetical protein
LKSKDGKQQKEDEIQAAVSAASALASLSSHENGSAGDGNGGHTDDGAPTLVESLLPHQGPGLLTGRDVILIPDAFFWGLPLETMCVLSKCKSVSRDFSLHSLYRRIQQLKTNAATASTSASAPANVASAAKVNRKLTYIVDPLLDAPETRFTRAFQMIKQQAIKASNWVGLTGQQHQPVEGEVQRLLSGLNAIPPGAGGADPDVSSAPGAVGGGAAAGKAKAGAAGAAAANSAAASVSNAGSAAGVADPNVLEGQRNAFLFLGFGKFLSFLSAEKFANVDLEQMTLLFLIDRAVNENSFRRQAKADSSKHWMERSLERPYVTALLASVNGATTVVVNQYAVSPKVSAHAFASLCANMTGLYGSKLGVSVQKWRTTVPEKKVDPSTSDVSSSSSSSSASNSDLIPPNSALSTVSSGSKGNLPSTANSTGKKSTASQAALLQQMEEERLAKEKAAKMEQGLETTLYANSETSWTVREYDQWNLIVVGLPDVDIRF